MAKKIKGGTRGTVFKVIASMRLEDARVLLTKGRLHGALYLAGYAVECALKWAVTQRRNILYLPAELEIHDLQKLVAESGLISQLRDDVAIAPLFSALVDEWGPQERYAASKLDDRTAKRLYNQTKQVYLWLIERVT